MRLHTDIPSRAEIDRLLQVKGPWCVTIYLPTEPTSTGEAERIELKNRIREVRDRLTAAGADSGVISAVEAQLTELEDDEAFWRYQARVLATFVTPTSLATFRLPNRLQPMTAVGDRFHLKPLMRAVTFPQTAFVLALAQGSARLFELVLELPLHQVEVPGMPADIDSVTDSAWVYPDRAPRRRFAGDEEQKMRMRLYARRVDQALRGVLPVAGVPLILAAAEPLGSIFRSVCRYPDLAEEKVPGNPEDLTEDQLFDRAREVLDRFNATRLRELHRVFEQRSAQGRTATDIADVARLATMGAVDTVFVDIDRPVPGQVDEETGAVTFGSSDDPTAYGIVDEIARRVWLTGGQVLAVRREDIPNGGDVAAILRYTPV
mgnify:CR=1 FL=1